MRIRDKTMSRFYRKAKRVARGISKACRKRGISEDKAYTHVLYGLNQKLWKANRWRGDWDYDRWTFYSYAKLAARKMGKKGEGIRRQIGQANKNLRRIAAEAIEQAYCGGA